MRSFLDGTLMTIIIFLGVLSGMLLYSLMLSDVDAKTYQYGMLRALGFKKRMLIGMICEQAIGFSIPGLLLGTMIAWILNIELRRIIFVEAQNYLTYELAGNAVIIGVVFGLLMPVVANYLPIKSAMGQTLRNALDLSKRTDGEIGVKIQKLEQIGMDTNQLIVSVLLISIGFSTYYVVPYGFIHNNLSLVSTVMNLLLVLIMMGLSMICVLIFPFLEQLLLWTTLNTCCRRDNKLKKVIESNMDGHRKRNSKTSIMFTLAISFLIFSASSFELLSTLIEKTVLSFIGADLQAIALSGYIHEIPIANFLD